MVTTQLDYLNSYPGHFPQHFAKACCVVLEIIRGLRVAVCVVIACVLDELAETVFRKSRKYLGGMPDTQCVPVHLDWHFSFCPAIQYYNHIMSVCCALQITNNIYTQRMFFYFIIAVLCLAFV